MRYHEKNKALAIAGVSFYIISVVSQLTMCLALLDELKGMVIMFALLSSGTMIAGTACFIKLVLIVAKEGVRLGRDNDPIG